MRISIPNRLDEIDLGQMIALVNLEQLRDSIEEEMTEAQAIKFEQLVSDITGLSIRVIQMFEKENFDRVMKAVNTLLQDFKGRFMQIITAKEQQQKIILKHESKMRWFKKDKVFHITDPKTEPTHLWITLLDGVLKRTAKLEPVDLYKSVREIPYTLACIGWCKGVDRLTENRKKELVVNLSLVAEKKERLKKVNAIEAIRCFSFFLSTTTDFNKTLAMQRYIEQLSIQIMNQHRNKNKSPKNTDGMDTSKMSSVEEITTDLKNS